MEEGKKVLEFKSLFATDKKAEEDGKWIDFVEGVRFLIARAGGAKFASSSRRHFRPYRSLINAKKEIPYEASINATSNIIADSILFGWEGVVIDGKEIEFTREAALSLLLEHRDFRDWVWEISSASENFKLEELDELGKG